MIKKNHAKCVRSQACTYCRTSPRQCLLGGQGNILPHTQPPATRPGRAPRPEPQQQGWKQQLGSSVAGTRAQEGRGRRGALGHTGGLASLLLMLLLLASPQGRVARVAVAACALGVTQPSSLSEGVAGDISERLAARAASSSLVACRALLAAAVASCAPSPAAEGLGRAEVATRYHCMVLKVAIGRQRSACMEACAEQGGEPRCGWAIRDMEAQRAGRAVSAHT